MAVPSSDPGVSLSRDASGLAESAWVRFGGSKVGGLGGSAITMMEDFVYARLLVKHPSTPHTTLHEISSEAVTSVVNEHSSQAQPPTVTGAVSDTLSGAAKHVPGVQQAEDISHFLGRLSDPTTWLRAVYIVGGSILVLSGVFIVAKEMGAPVPEPPIVTTARVAKKALTYKRAKPKGKTT